MLDLVTGDELVDDGPDRVRRDGEPDSGVPSRFALDLAVDADDLAAEVEEGPPEFPWLIAASVWMVPGIE